MTFVAHRLRTVEPESAVAFYETLTRWRAAPTDFGFVLASPTGGVAITRLPAMLEARGVPDHWLGTIGVPDLDAAVTAFTRRGAVRLGPPGPAALMRDPFGAIIELTAKLPPAPSPIAWNELHTTDVDAALKTYGAITPWTRVTTLDTGLDVGPYVVFGWQDESSNGRRGAISSHPDGSSPIGGLIGSARRPGVHVHWLYYLPVDDLAAATVRAKVGGGRLIGRPQEMPDGTRVAQFEDPLGGTFGLRQSADGAI